MYKSVFISVFLLLQVVLSPLNVIAAPLGDCSLEPALGGRSDVVMCESWESNNWWAESGYVRDGGLAPAAPVMADQMEYTSVVSSGCLDGKCLKIDTPTGVTRSLNIHWPLINAGLEPEELYFRYHFKIGSNWTPEQCGASGPVWPASGKFWGLADARASRDPGGQCGNGGASSDGVSCWSARGVFHGCESGYSNNGFPFETTCDAVPNARTRIGTYLYVPNNGTTHGANALWDAVAERNTLGDDFSSSCRRDDPNNPDPDCYCNATNNLYCGKGSGGQLETDRWYAIETYVKMNTPGVADGIIRGWVDDVLSYEKTNVLFRNQGHDNLHVRTVWLNTYKGGVRGNCEDSALYYDQMAIATQRIGKAVTTGARPNPPDDLQVSP